MLRSPVMVFQCARWLALLVAAAFPACNTPATKAPVVASTTDQVRPQTTAQASGEQASNGEAGPSSFLPGHDALMAALRRLVAKSEQPVALALLDAESKGVLALLGHLGADPALTPLRPGSTVKPLLAWFAANAGVPMTAARECRGTYEDGYHCFATHGELTLSQALATSCNVYAYQLAGDLGLEQVAAGFARFGFGRKTGLVSEEAAGLVADGAWFAAHGRPPPPRPELLVGIGHGPIEVTPLQLAVAYVELLQRLHSPAPSASRTVNAEILAGLRAVVESAQGTGRAAAVPGLTVGGKTGTAEAGSYGADLSGENGWFVGVAPLEAPKVVVAVVVLGAGQAGATAAPLASEVISLALGTETPTTTLGQSR